MKRIEFKCLTNKGRTWICFFFPNDEDLKMLMKGLPGAGWHPGMKCWYLEDTSLNRARLKDLFQDRTLYEFRKFQDKSKQEAGNGSPKAILPGLDQEDFQLIGSFKKWMRYRRYSESTIRTYSEMTVTFLRFIKPKRATDEVMNDIQRFTNEYILVKRLSFSYQNQLVNALRLFYKEIMRQELTVEQIRRPRKEYKLPNVLSKREVKMLLEVLKNVKHRVMLSTIYSCGLRRGELLNLKPADIDSNRGLLIIRQAKGRKDRVVPISEKIIKMLREYYIQYRPTKWMFEGVKSGEQYDERSLQQVLKKAIFLAGIKKPVTLHWLRHSYATHLHEAGVDIRYIQELLGHKSSRTTEIYTHVSARSIRLIRSPFDDL
ncbi:MAG: site-specific integrase [Bacteroidales bacterium]|jgi:integrase/recombinase XerD|nr:site-specific integrase [Bacteroidales bacterium]